MSPKATADQRAFNSMGGALSVPKSKPAADSWWASPELQHDREAFQKKLVDEEIRMLGTRFGRMGPTMIDKFPQPRKKR